MAKEKSNGRQHKATYSRDKEKGGYLIRVQGPHANRFANRVVPVTRKDLTEENEQLTTLIWTGNDKETGEPVALYNFEAKPKDAKSEEYLF